MGKRHDQDLVDRIAHDLLARHMITLVVDEHQRYQVFIRGQAQICGYVDPNSFCGTVWQPVESRLKHRRSETLGKIVGAGPAHSFEMANASTTRFMVAHSAERELGMLESGRSLLEKIAVMTGIARMWDFLTADLKTHTVGELVGGG